MIAVTILKVMAKDLSLFSGSFFTKTSLHPEHERQSVHHREAVHQK